MKKMFLFIFLMIMFGLNVNAEACDAYDIKRLKEIAEGVEITYELQEPFNNGLTIINDYYVIKSSGLTDEIFIYNEEDDFYLTKNENFAAYVKSGRKKLVIKANGCSSILKKVTLSLPVYNDYFGSVICEGNENLDVCKQWVESDVSEKELYAAISVANENNGNKDNFFEKYKFFVICGVVFVIVIISFVIVKKRKEVLE